MSSSVSAAESSLLLWVLAAVISIMAAHVCQGWLRQAALLPGLRLSWTSSLIAAAVLGTSITAAVVLSMSAEPMPFPLGYRLRDAPLLWLGAIAGCVPAMLWLGLQQRWFAYIGSGIMLGALSVALHLGWANAVGFRPGLVWQKELVLAAALFSMLGISIALSMAFSTSNRANHRRRQWRLGAALLMGLTVLAGHQIALAGANLATQVGSVFRTEVPAPLLCLLLGVLLPLGLSLLMIDLHLRRDQQRREHRREVRKRHEADSQLRAVRIAEESALNDRAMSSQNAPGAHAG